MNIKWFVRNIKRARNIQHNIILYNLLFKSSYILNSKSKVSGDKKNELSYILVSLRVRAWLKAHHSA